MVDRRSKRTGGKHAFKAGRAQWMVIPHPLARSIWGSRSYISKGMSCCLRACARVSPTTPAPMIIIGGRGAIEPDKFLLLFCGRWVVDVEIVGIISCSLTVPARLPFHCVFISRIAWLRVHHLLPRLPLQSD